MKRLSLNVGINNYRGAQLSGCVNDAVGWNGLAVNNGYESVLLLDEDATRENILASLKGAVDQLRWGDRFLFTFSGHGSNVADRNGDEQDGRDEVLVPVDFQYIVDDELGIIFDSRRRGSRVTIISDSCFSGSASRFTQIPTGEEVWNESETGPVRKTRFYPSQFLEPRPAVVRRELTVPKPTVLLSGCRDDQVSYDVHIEGSYQGAMSWAARKSFKPGQSMLAWRREILRLLALEGFDQEPQLTAAGWQRYWSLP